MGDNTTHGYFYKPALGARGESEKTLFDAALDATDLFLQSINDRFFGDTSLPLLNSLLNNTVLELNNDGTGHGLYIHQDGVLATSKHGLYVYSNAIQISSALVNIVNGSTSSQHDTMSVRNFGSGDVLEIVHANTAFGGGTHALYVYGNAADVNADSALVKLVQLSASATEPILELDNDGIGHGLYMKQDGALATGKYALYIDNNGTPVDGAGRCIRLDGCTVTSTKSPETDAEVGFIGINIGGTQYAVPYYALS